MDVAALVEPVSDLLRAAADSHVRPRFRALADDDVAHKAAGEVVTAADREAETAITAGLIALAPGVPVVGEEAAAADGSLTGALTAPYCWLVDPLDGTQGFVDGSPDYAVMAALLRAGETVAAWVLQPERDVVWTAQRGGGTRRNGVEVTVGAREPDVVSLRVGVMTRFLDAGTAAAVDSGARAFARVDEPPRCAGVVYPALVEGAYDAVLFWRTLPWDHAPGVLLLTEAGGAVARPDGTAYVVADGRVGLLAVAHPDAWRPVRDALLGSAS